MLMSVMTTTNPSVERLPNEDLLADIARLGAGERLATARLIGALAEVDARRLYLGEGARSLLAYCTRVLHLSEHAAGALDELDAELENGPRTALLCLEADPATCHRRVITDALQARHPDLRVVDL